MYGAREKGTERKERRGMRWNNRQRKTAEMSKEKKNRRKTL